MLSLTLIGGGVYFKKGFDKSSLPKREGSVILPGLAHKVETRFDSYGIPHVSCKKETECAYALGYLHAQDRLFQMEMLRRVGSGRLSEIFGQKTLETDRFFRTLGLDELAKQYVETFRKSAAQNFLRSYIDGINVFISQENLRLNFSC